MPNCRLCSRGPLAPFLRLKDLPISHRLRRSTAEPDPRFTVDFDVCQNCGMLQIVNPIPASALYADSDTYCTAFQKPRHLDDLITTAIARQEPGSVLDVGCNDGALMDALKQHGYDQVIGIEPNTDAGALAKAKGFYVFRGFINEPWAGEFRGQFDAVYCRHVLEHVANIGAFMRAIRTVLRDGGQLVLELPDVEEAMRLGSPAILWEEHVSYFTQALAEYMLARHGFEVTDRRRYAFGGGSMAFVARKVQPRDVEPPDVSRSLGLLRCFRERLERQRAELAALVSKARAAGRPVVLYGAAPRSCMMVAACGIGDKLDAVVDDRPEIQGRLMPGTSKIIRALDTVTGTKPWLCLLGVGAENESRVRRRVRVEADASATFISLFPPRDTLASILEMAA